MPIELRQISRLRTTLEVASSTALQPGPAGVLVYANARNSVVAALKGTQAADEFELLFPPADASFSLSPEYPIVLVGQLIVWLRELEREQIDSVVSPELALVDPELRRLAPLVAEPQPQAEQAPSAEPRPTVFEEADAGPAAAGNGSVESRSRPLALAAGAYALRASMRTVAIDVAFFLLLACIVLLISVR